jgi:hypothetical protein
VALGLRGDWWLQLLYETGPRPSPYRVVKWLVPNDIWGKLVVSVILDVIGSSSYALPVGALALVTAGKAVQRLYWGYFRTIAVILLARMEAIGNE